MREPNNAPRSQKPPLPGERPPGAQGVAASTCYVAAETPLLGTPRLQSNDAFDQPTVDYLLRKVLLEHQFWEDVERQGVSTNEEVDRDEAEEARQLKEASAELARVPVLQEEVQGAGGDGPERPACGAGCAAAAGEPPLPSTRSTAADGQAVEGRDVLLQGGQERQDAVRTTG